MRKVKYLFVGLSSIMAGLTIGGNGGNSALSNVKWNPTVRKVATPENVEIRSLTNFTEMGFGIQYQNPEVSNDFQYTMEFDSVSNGPLTDCGSDKHMYVAGKIKDKSGTDVAEAGYGVDLIEYEFAGDVTANWIQYVNAVYYDKKIGDYVYWLIELEGGYGDVESLCMSFDIDEFDPDFTDYEFIYITSEEILPPNIASFFPSYVEGSGPVIAGDSQTLVTNVDNPLTVEQIKKGLSAWDETDGDITSRIVVDSDDYTANCHKIGSYEIVFSVTDSAGNKATLTVTVIVQDLTDPVINGPESLTYSYTKQTAIAEIITNYTVTDNYDTDLSVVVEDDGGFDGSVCGTYTLVLKTTDTSGHIGRKTITVRIIDDVAPVFSGSTSFVTSNKTSASLQDVKGFCKISATDAIDGTCEVQVQSNTFTGNANKVGDYQIVFFAVDKSGNKATFTVNCTVRDEIAPVFYIDTEVIYASVSVASELSSNDLVNMMCAVRLIDGNKQFKASIDDKDGLFEVETPEVRDYEFDVSVSYADGNSDRIRQVIRVYEEKDGDIVDNSKTDNGFVRSLKWIHNNILKPIGRMVWALVDYTVVTLYRVAQWAFTGKWLPFYDHTIFK